MAYKYTIDCENRIVLIEISGIDTKEDIFERITKITGEPDWSPGFGVFMDMRRVEKLEVNFDDSFEITRFHKLISQIILNCKIALICQHAHVFGIGRMWQSLSETLEIEFEIFEDTDLAKEWILS